jgi:ribonucleoside-diphosphate reductase alpha chain
MWEQLENAAQIQAYWSDNSVSITVNIKKEEFDQLDEALSRYQTRLKAVSFLPNSDHSYQQAPYQEITEKEYKDMMKKIKPLDLSFAEHEVTDKFCDSDVCQI